MRGAWRGTWRGAWCGAWPCCLLPAACCLMLAACCLLLAACCLMLAACCLLRKDALHEFPRQVGANARAGANAGNHTLPNQNNHDAVRESIDLPFYIGFHRHTTAAGLLAASHVIASSRLFQWRGCTAASNHQPATSNQQPRKADSAELSGSRCW